ncbi:MAG: hypothetical protein ACTJHU_07640, partial [Mycetocola sp.]
GDSPLFEQSVELTQERDEIASVAVTVEPEAGTYESAESERFFTVAPLEVAVYSDAGEFETPVAGEPYEVGIVVIPTSAGQAQLSGFAELLVDGDVVDVQPLSQLGPWVDPVDGAVNTAGTAVQTRLTDVVPDGNDTTGPFLFGVAETVFAEAGEATVEVRFTGGNNVGDGVSEPVTVTVNAAPTPEPTPAPHGGSDSDKNGGSDSGTNGRGSDSSNGSAHAGLAHTGADTVGLIGGAAALLLLAGVLLAVRRSRGNAATHSVE